MDNVFVKSLFDFLHLLATIAWFGTLFVNVAILRGTVQKILTPPVAGPFIKLFMQKARIVVYVSLAILFITGIPMKIVSPYYVSIIDFSNIWQIFMFVKHVFVAVLALLAIINFEFTLPSFQRVATAGPSPELEKMKKVQMLTGMLSAVLAFIIILISAVMNHV